jgi:peptidoglycan/LPS O-acetylase OafA/YrhL
MSIKAPEPTQHVRSLDALRGMLSVFVVAAHAWQVFSLPQTGDTWANQVFGFPARAAVLCFFCLSGYVIAMSIHGNMRRNGAFDPMEYAVSRFMRIAPPFLGVVALTWLFAVILNAADASHVGLKGAARPDFLADPLGQVLALLTLTTIGDLTGKLVNGPVWSLVFEIQLYVIAALAVLAWSWRGSRRNVVLVVLVAYIAVFGIHGLKLRTLTYVAFGFGAAGYVFRSISQRTLLWGLGTAIPVAALFGYWASFYPVTLWDGAIPWICFQVAASAVFALLVLAASRTSLTLQVTDYSYTLYILHFPLFLFVYFLMQRYWPDGLARWANPLAFAAVPFAVLASACVGRLEKVRLRSRRPPQPVAPLPRAELLMREVRTPSVDPVRRVEGDSP